MELCRGGWVVKNRIGGEYKMVKVWEVEGVVGGDERGEVGG